MAEVLGFGELVPGVALDGDSVPTPPAQHEACLTCFFRAASSCWYQLDKALVCPIKLTAIMNDNPYFCNAFFLRTLNNMLLTKQRAGFQPVY